jgi:hypothetical protein
MNPTAANAAIIETPAAESRWSNLIPESEWVIYKEVLLLAMERNIPFALGGGFAYSYYVQAWRDTKDIDLYILPEHREPMLQVLTETGFYDYFEKLPYDRRWIYRGYREGLITDVIWAMANQRTQVTRDWLTRGPQVEVRGIALPVIPAEELVWSKLYVLQRDRCDWPDLLNILHARVAELDWRRLLECIGDDARLLGGVLNVLAWMCPSRAREVPEFVWSRVSVVAAGGNHDCIVDSDRVKLLDSRDWFPPLRK